MSNARYQAVASRIGDQSFSLNCGTNGDPLETMKRVELSRRFRRVMNFLMRDARRMSQVSR